MKEYISPTYSVENVETSDIMLTSLLYVAGEHSLNGITGKKVVFDTSFSDLLGNR